MIDIIKFTLGLILGIFLIPTIKELKYKKMFIGGFKSILRHPIDFIEDIFEITFKSGY